MPSCKKCASKNQNQSQSSKTSVSKQPQYIQCPSRAVTAVICRSPGAPQCKECRVSEGSPADTVVFYSEPTCTTASNLQLPPQLRDKSIQTMSRHECATKGCNKGCRSKCSCRCIQDVDVQTSMMQYSDFSDFSQKCYKRKWRPCNSDLHTISEGTSTTTSDCSSNASCCSTVRSEDMSSLVEKHIQMIEEEIPKGAEPLLYDQYGSQLTQEQVPQKTEPVQEKIEDKVAVVEPKDQEPPAVSEEDKKQTEEYEYLQFLIRITEDLLINDYYTNSDMEIVFGSHVEANKGRLSTKKMMAKIDDLKRDLNIPLVRDKRHLCVCQMANKEFAKGTLVLNDLISDEHCLCCTCAECQIRYAGPEDVEERMVQDLAEPETQIEKEKRTSVGDEGQEVEKEGQKEVWDDDGDEEQGEVKGEGEAVGEGQNVMDEGQEVMNEIREAMEEARGIMNEGREVMNEIQEVMEEAREVMNEERGVIKERGEVMEEGRVRNESGGVINEEQVVWEEGREVMDEGQEGIMDEGEEFMGEEPEHGWTLRIFDAETAHPDDDIESGSAEGMLEHANSEPALYGASSGNIIQMQGVPYYKRHVRRYDELLDLSKRKGEPIVTGIAVNNTNIKILKENEAQDQLFSSNVPGTNKPAFKAQLNSEDQEYVLLTDPVCVPKWFLESHMCAVLVADMPPNFFEIDDITGGNQHLLRLILVQPPEENM